MKKSIYLLSELDKDSIPVAGGKGASLGEMTKAGFPVPPGFVISAAAFEEFLHETNAVEEIEAMWSRLNIRDIENVEENAEIIRDVLLQKKFPEALGKEILSAFDILGESLVAVRSSATAEDSEIDAWAGQLESYMYVARDNLLGHVQKCWASLYTPRALFYRAERGLTRKDVSVAVVVQKMVASGVAGVCFTVHPVTQDNNQMILEACWGLGESLVLGLVTPDSYIFEKDTATLLDTNVSSQERMIVRDTTGVQTVDVPLKKQEQQKLTDQQVKELALLCLKIEKHYGKPLDIEWALEKENFAIVQARAITTLQEKGEKGAV